MNRSDSYMSSRHTEQNVGTDGEGKDLTELRSRRSQWRVLFAESERHSSSDAGWKPPSRTGHYEIRKDWHCRHTGCKDSKWLTLHSLSLVPTQQSLLCRETKVRPYRECEKVRIS
jgi:hypothetical protein